MLWQGIAVPAVLSVKTLLSTHSQIRQVLRILFGWFPTYRDSPLAPRFNRILQVGDASGIQSPLRWGPRLFELKAVYRVGANRTLQVGGAFG